jgi:hypothetical protein
MSAPQSLSSYVFPTAFDVTSVALMLTQITPLLNNALNTFNLLNQLTVATTLNVSIPQGTPYPFTSTVELQTISQAVNAEIVNFETAYATFITNLQAYVAQIPG